MPAAKATAVMAAVVGLAHFVTAGYDPLVRLLAQVAAGCLAYAGAVAVVSGGRLRTVVRSLLRRSSPSD
jgi:hypothetical protein